jgi:hypothetical protein
VRHNTAFACRLWQLLQHQNEFCCPRNVRFTTAAYQTSSLKPEKNLCARKHAKSPRCYRQPLFMFPSWTCQIFVQEHMHIARLNPTLRAALNSEEVTAGKWTAIPNPINSSVLSHLLHRSSGALQDCNRSAKALFMHSCIRVRLHQNKAPVMLWHRPWWFPVMVQVMQW